LKRPRHCCRGLFFPLCAGQGDQTRRDYDPEEAGGVEPPPGAGVVELSGAGVVGAGVEGAGLDGAGMVVDGSEPAGLAVSSFLSQAVSATATTEARIKVLLIMLDSC